MVQFKSAIAAERRVGEGRGVGVEEEYVVRVEERPFRTRVHQTRIDEPKGGARAGGHDSLLRAHADCLLAGLSSDACMIHSISFTSLYEEATALRLGTVV